MTTLVAGIKMIDGDPDRRNDHGVPTVTVWPTVEGHLVYGESLGPAATFGEAHAAVQRVAEAGQALGMSMVDADGEERAIELFVVEG